MNRTAALTVVAAALACSGPRPAPAPPPSPAPAPPPVAPPAVPEPVAEEPARPWEAVPVGQIALVAAVTSGFTSAGQGCSPTRPVPLVESPWVDLPLQSTWAREPAQIEPAACVKGWCDGFLMAFPVTGGGTGALLRADPTAPALETLSPNGDPGVPVSDCPDPPETEEEGSPVEDCAVAFGASRAIQVHGRGVVQPNQFPLLERCEARILRREGGRWVAGPWAPLPGLFGRLPVPLAQSADQVVWLGDLEVWIGSFQAEGWTVEQRVGGGIDAGCD